MLRAAYEVIDQDHMHGYARKYGLSPQYIQSILSALFISGRVLFDGKVELKMPADEDEVDQPSGQWTGEFVEVKVDADRGAVTWIGIEGVNMTPAPIRVEDVKQSKIGVCRDLYDPKCSRKENLRMFVQGAHCTEAGAATYYAKIRKECV